MSKRAIRQSRKKSQQKTSLWIYVGLGLIVVVAVILVILNGKPGGAAASTAGLMGEEVPILSRDHVANNAPPPAYNSNPPAGGAHFSDPLPASQKRRLTRR